MPTENDTILFHDQLSHQMDALDLYRSEVGEEVASALGACRSYVFERQERKDAAIQAAENHDGKDHRLSFF